MDFNSVYTVIDYIGEHAKSTAERGSWWERAVMFYLRHDPEMRQIMGEVTLWEDAPTNDGHDTGIDIVCEYDAAASQASADGRKYWAVQCKNYDAAHKMDYKELSTFWQDVYLIDHQVVPLWRVVPFLEDADRLRQPVGAGEQTYLRPARAPAERRRRHQ